MLNPTSAGSDERRHAEPGAYRVSVTTCKRYILLPGRLTDDRSSTSNNVRSSNRSDRLRGCGANSDTKKTRTHTHTHTHACINNNISFIYFITHRHRAAKIDEITYLGKKQTLLMAVLYYMPYNIIHICSSDNDASAILYIYIHASYKSDI